MTDTAIAASSAKMRPRWEEGIILFPDGEANDANVFLVNNWP